MDKNEAMVRFAKDVIEQRGVAYIGRQGVEKLLRVKEIQYLADTGVVVAVIDEGGDPVAYFETVSFVRA